MSTKNRVLSHITQCLAVILLLFIVRYTIIPITNEISDRITEQKELFLTYLERELGITFTYSSLSPLIMDSVKLYDVEIHTPGERNNISLASLSIKFSLWELVLSNWRKVSPPSVIKSIYLKSGYVNLDFNDEWMQNLFSGGGSGNSILGFKVFVDNVDVSLKIGDLYIESMESYGSIAGRNSRYETELRSFANVVSPGFGDFKYITADATFDGYLSRDFSQFEFRSNLKTIDTNVGRFKDLDLHLQMDKGLLELETLGKNSNIDLKLKGLLENNEYAFGIKVDNFRISDLILTKPGVDLFDPVKGSVISAEVDAVYNFNYNTLQYSSIGSAFVNTDPVNLSVNYNVVGDLDHMTVRKVNLSSKMGYLGFTGGVNLRTLYPQGNFYVRDLDLGGNHINSDFKIEVIDDNFLSVEFDYIETLGVSLNSISTIIYRDDEEISFQGLKREGNGRLGFHGSYSLDNNQLDAAISIQNLDLGFISPVTPEGYIKELVDISELDLELDLKYLNNSIEYNVNSLSLNSDGEEYLFLEARGIDNLFFVDYLEYNSTEISVQGGFEGKVEDNHIFVNIEALINDNKYNILMDLSEDKLTLTGSYGLNCTVLLEDNIYVDLFCKDLPLNYMGYSAVSTIEGKGALLTDNQFLVSLKDFSSIVSIPGLSYKPEISFKMDASNEEIYLYDMTLIDNITSIYGDMRLGLRELLTLDVNLNNEVENIVISSNVTRDFDNVDVLMDIENLNLSRLQQDNLSGKVNLSLTFNGNMEQFRLLGSLNSEDLFFNNNNSHINFDYNVDEELVTITDFRAVMDKIETTIPLLTYSYPKGDVIGKVNYLFDSEGLNVHGDVALDISFNPVESLFNTDFNLLKTASGDISILDLNLGENQLMSNKTFRLYHNRSALQVYSYDRLLKLFYSYNSGLINFISKSPYFMDLTATGIIKDGVMDLSVSDIDVDLSFTKVLLESSGLTELLTMDSLDLHGELNLKGELLNPLINGLLWLDAGVDVIYLSEELEPLRINIRAVDNKVSILGTEIAFGGAGLLNIDGEMLIDSYIPEVIVLNIDIPEENSVSVIYEYTPVVIETSIYTPNMVFYWDDSGSILTGDIYIEDGEFYTSGLLPETTEETEVTKLENAGRGSGIEVDLNVIFSKGNRLYWPNKDVPIVDATLNPGDTLAVKYRSITEEYSVKGLMSIVSGEVNYSGKPFVLREGAVELDMTPETFNPFIRLTAAKTVMYSDSEDESSIERPIEVILSFEGGLFSDFKPTFSSDDPTQDDDAIKKVVGEAFTDSDIGAAFAGLGDEVLTSLITASLEESLEENLGIDEVNIKSGFITALAEQLDLIDSSNITNNSFDEDEESGYNLSEMLENTSITFGDFVTDEFFIKGTLQTVYEDEELNLDMDLGFNLYTPHFQLGVNVAPNFSDDFTFEPELGLSLEWVYTP